MTDRHLRRALPSPTSLLTITCFLILISLSSAVAARFPLNPPIEVTVDAPDSSVELVGRLEIPHASLVKGGKPPLLILLHQFGMSNVNWGMFTEQLLRNGIAFLAMDLPGHGLSIYDLKQQKNRPPYSYYTGELLNFPQDVAALVEQTIRLHHDRFDTTRIAVLGAGLGANVGLLYAHNDPRVRYIALVSPGLEFNQLRIAPVLREFDDRPIMIAYSDTDVYAVQTVDLLTDIIPRKFDLFVSSSMYAGNRLLNSEPALQAKVLDDLRRFLVREK